MEREHLGSRLGFIMLSAGCAIGCGNVWKFPWMTGQFGGGSFVLVYILCLLILGLPVMTMEFTVGRAAQKSPVKMFQTLQKPGQKWGFMGWIALVGNFSLMAFYTVVCGWIINYFCKFLIGQNADLGFGPMISDPGLNVTFLAVTVVAAFVVLSFNLQGGLERVTKYMMVALLVLMLVLAAHSLTLPGAKEGIAFYLVPDFSKINGSVIVGAMNQAFFTLSLGIGSMAIFGSYIDKERSLLGESVNVILLDTLVALLAGFIMFPACFSYDLEVGQGPSLLFNTMATVFNNMPGGRVWGTLFFLFMVFAAMSTVLAVCENILAMTRDLFGWQPHLRDRRLPAGPDHRARLQRAFLPALCGGLRVAGFLGFHRLHQRAAHRQPDLRFVLLQQIRLGLGQLRPRGERRPGPSGEAVDETAVSVRRTRSDPVHLRVRHGDLQMALSPA